MPKPDEPQTTHFWLEKPWVVAQMDHGPEFWACTKRRCLEYCSGCALDPDPTTERIRSGLYKYCYVDEHSIKATEFWIGRPEAFMEQGIDYMIRTDVETSFKLEK